MEYAIYKYCAIIGGTLVGIQLVLQMFGLGGDHDADADHGESTTEGHGNLFFGILSFKALTAFAGVFGLVGLVVANRSMGGAARVATATGAGVVSMFLVAWVMRGLARLQASGTVDVRNALGASATVYLRIPGSRAGRGKVTVDVQGRSMEYAAVTDGDTLETGTLVTVESVEGEDLLKVARS
jgi:hypothetical protein